MNLKAKLREIGNCLYELPSNAKPCMRVPALLVLSPKLLQEVEEGAIEQAANVACLPGIYKHSIALPDMHYGYGFCVHPETKVMSEHGYYVKIKDFDKFLNKRVVFYKNNNGIRFAEVLRFYELETYTKLFKIKTKLGYEIVATEDHPFYAKDGMVELKNLKEGCKVAIYPFEGVCYVDPSNEIIIDESDILIALNKLKLSKKRKEIITKKLRERKLLPLTYSSEKLPYLLKIIGFVFGDGTMNFISKKKDGIISFCSKSFKDLELIREDVKKLRYTPSPIYKRIKNGKDYYVFYVNASSLVILLYALGVPLGNKVFKKFRVPKWIFKCELWQKRLFLASFFGAELAKPCLRNNRKALFAAPSLEMAKDVKIENNAKEFLEDIAEILKEFGVEARVLKRSKIYKRKDGKETCRYYLNICSNSKNLINFWAKINYEYNKEKRALACYALAFLRYRESLIERRKRLAEKVRELYGKGFPLDKIKKKLKIPKRDERFVESIYSKLKKGHKTENLRIPQYINSFSEFLKKHAIEDGLIWDEIAEIKEINSPKHVYDLTINDESHNFIANNFVISNCIGGVAALDYENGGISPGGVGFDINCIAEDSEILLRDGYRIKIKELDNLKGNLKVVTRGKTAEDKDILLILKRKKGKRKIYKIVTNLGRQLILSEDHLVFCLDNVKKASDLNVGDRVIIYPFEGVEREEKNGIILSYEDFKECDKQIINLLKRLDLLPLTYSNPKIGILARLVGYILGDGCIFRTYEGGRERLITYVCGKEEDLNVIREEIKELGFKSSRIYRRQREIKGKNYYTEFLVRNEETWIKVCSKTFSLLIHKLGVPIGRKSECEFKVPEWVKKAPLWIKRNFLAGFFGAETTMLMPIKGHEYNFIQPMITVGKRKELKFNGYEFLLEIAELLEEFGVEISGIYEIPGTEKTVGIRLVISNKLESLINLYTKIGFEYNNKRHILGLLVAHYLMIKKARLLERKKAIALINALKGNACVSDIVKKLNGVVNRRFVERTLYENREEPRIDKDFLTFNDYYKEIVEKLGFTGFVYEKVIRKEEVDYSGELFDLTVADNHNFVANGFLVHNCGVRLLRTNLMEQDVRKKLRDLLEEIFRNVPSGVGRGGKIKLSMQEVKNEVLNMGARWAVEHGYGYEKDLEHTEEKGCLEYADPEKVSVKALQRGAPQLGSLGAGNHFLEVQVVDKIYLPEVAKAFGIEKEGQVCIMTHTGSRGLGHQVCTDYLRILEHSFRHILRKLPDKELVFAPSGTKEQENYFAAMCCAANFAWCNRQMITHWVRQSFCKALRMDEEDLGLEVIYDVAHNIAKIEEHKVNGEKKKVFVHRKGATRAFPAKHKDIPKDYKNIGQPVLIPGSMGTASYVLVGTQKAMELTFGSTCHGSGRVLSRAKALKRFRGETVKSKLESRGILVRSASWKCLAEEAPEVYKNVDDVVRACELAGISRIVVRLRPIGVVKG